MIRRYNMLILDSVRKKSRELKEILATAVHFFWAMYDVYELGGEIAKVTFAHELSEQLREIFFATPRSSSAESKKLADLFRSKPKRVEAVVDYQHLDRERCYTLRMDIHFHTPGGGELLSVWFYTGSGWLAQWKWGTFV